MPLAVPDFWEFPRPDRTCLITDDGTLTTSRLAQLLTEQGWQVVVLSFPQSIVRERSPLPKNVNRVALTDLSEEQLQLQLAAISDTYGAIGAFIHLHPVSQLPDERSNPQSEKAILKHVFLLAKHLKQALNQTASKGRSCFLTVARLDGELGLQGIDSTGVVVCGGLFGLTKTLNLEWERVFCRAIDLSPDLNAEQSAHLILKEMHDPNSLITEVGYNCQGRVTLACSQ